MVSAVPGPRRFDQAFEIVRRVGRFNSKESKETERPGFLINVIFEIKNSLFGPSQLIESVDVVGIAFECFEAFFEPKTSPPKVVGGETIVRIAQKERDFAINFASIGGVETSKVAPLGGPAHVVRTIKKNWTFTNQLRTARCSDTTEMFSAMTKAIQTAALERDH